MSNFETDVWFFIVDLLPKKLIYHCSMRVTAFATMGKYGNTIVPELPAMDAMKRYADDHKL